MKKRRQGGRAHPILLAFVIIVVVALIAFFWLTWHSAIAKIAPPAPSSFDRALVHRGEQVALLGDCVSCHSMRTGAAYAGGLALQTDFGTIYSTNITPDPETGIGAWSQQAFARALREGVSRDGHLLYPAFPYNHFTHLSDQDLQALYAFFMTRTPAKARAPDNHLRFPLQFRPLVAGWNLLYLHPGPVPQEPARGPEWNRGAYLVQSAGHCAACHAPRTRLGGEPKGHDLSGGRAEDWFASALDARSPSPVPWTPESLAAWLATGLAPDHAIVAGPMQGVVHNLARVDPADVRAIASYIHAGMGPVSEAQRKREADARGKAALPSLVQARSSAPGPAPDAKTLQLGATVYQSACARCHDGGRQISSEGGLQLPLASALYEPVPDNLIHIIRQGIAPPLGERGRWMPAFEGSLSEEQLGALVTWLRHQASDQPPWKDVAQAVKQDRSMQ